MTNRTAQASPQVYARIGGVLYLIIIIIGFGTAFFIRGRTVVPGDAAATASNVAAFAALWRLGIAGDLILRVCDLAVVLVLYVLLGPVHRHVALLAMLLNLTQTAVMAAFELSLLVALFPLVNTDFLKVLEPQQLQAITQLSVMSYEYGFGIGLVFFGFACLAYGYLLFRSGYFPRALGVLMAMAGLSYLANSFTLILAPTIAATVFPVLVLALIGETSLSLWLIVKGVNLPNWERRIHQSG